MSSKRRKTSSPSAPAASSSSSSAAAAAPPACGTETLREVAKGFFLENKLSGRDVAALGRGGHNSGATDVDGFARAGAKGTQPKNAARDIMRHLLKNCEMPDIAWFPIRTWDKEGNCQVVQDLPFLLPHQVLDTLGDKLDAAKLTADTAPEIWDQYSKICRELQLDPLKCTPLGLHGDGVPFTKNQSLELLSWNVLGVAGGDRVPFTGVSKSFICRCGCLGRHTWDDVLSVMAWSIRALVNGVHPSVGPDGRQLEGKLLELARGKLQRQGVLCQIRGDWPFLKTLLSIPSWTSDRICWMCPADKSDTKMSYKCCSSDATWRQQRITGPEFLRSLQTQDLAPSTIFSCPGLRMEHVVLDWLHIVDLGIGQDLLGSFFSEITLGLGNCLDGSNRKERTHSLLMKIKAFYKEHGTTCKINELIPDMFLRKGAAPKLRAKGGETRNLIPFAAVFSAEIAEANPTPHFQMVARVFSLLMDCAKISAADRFDSGALATAARKLCVLWSQLRMESEAQGSLVWTMKPKLHLFQELCEYKSKDFGTPEGFWTYMDESYCGFLAKCAKRRGGVNRAATVPQRLLERYRAMKG